MLIKRTLVITIFIFIFFVFPIFAEVAPEVKQQSANGEKSEKYKMDDVYKQLEFFSTSMYYILQNFYKDLSKDDIDKAMSGAINGMLQGLGDRYSFYQPESRRKREQENLFFAKFGGLGIRILPSPDGFVNIVQPMDGTPAMKAGLRSGDKIIKVDGNSIENKPVDEVVDTLRGEVGTNVTITIIRPGRNEPFDVTITRSIINFPSVRHIMMEDKIGYVSISSFTAETGEEMRKSIEELKKDGLRGLIIDLRNNTGGMMSTAVAVSDAFLSNDQNTKQYDGVIVSTDGRLDKFDSVYKADPELLVPNDMPVVLLVNGGSASGSEIVAGALKDYKRATLIGEKTFGKGVVQQRFPLDEDRAVSVTVSIYKTPSGAWINEKGIEPDIEVKQPNLLEGEDDEMIMKLYRGEYVDKYVYGYLDAHPDQADKEQLKTLEDNLPELMKTLADNEIKLSEKLIRRYVRRTFESTKDMLSYDLENDLQLAKAIEEIKKKLG
jgi:carboxyl-terminal processing protease